MLHPDSEPKIPYIKKALENEEGFLSLHRIT